MKTDTVSLCVFKDLQKAAAWRERVVITVGKYRAEKFLWAD